MGILEKLSWQISVTNDYLNTLCEELREAKEEFSAALDKLDEQDKE